MQLKVGDLPDWRDKMREALRDGKHRAARRAGHRKVTIRCPLCGDRIAVWGVLDRESGAEGYPLDEMRCRPLAPPSDNPRAVVLPTSTQLVCSNSKCPFEQPRGDRAIGAVIVAAAAAQWRSVTVVDHF